MSKLAAGKEVLSFCNKCKLTLGHTIMAMKDVDTIGKVMCNTCKSIHAFKDPNAPEKSTTKKVVAKKTRKPRVSKTDQSIMQWEKSVAFVETNRIPYSPKRSFVKGDLISHVKFGDGIVEANLEADKIEVLFKTGIKILIHNK